MVGTRLQSLRIMLAIAAELDYKVHILGVQTALLNAYIEEDMFARMTPGYEINDKTRVAFAMKLKKSLYGLRQSPKTWFGPMDVKLAVISFPPLKSDPCVYIHEDETGSVILTLYVDDILFLSASETLLNKLKK